MHISFSFFYGISTFVGYLMTKPSLLKASASGTEMVSKLD